MIESKIRKRVFHKIVKNSKREKKVIVFINVKVKKKQGVKIKIIYYLVCLKKYFKVQSNRIMIADKYDSKS